MSLLVPGLLATSVLFASGIRQLNAFKQGEIRDATSQLLGVLGCILAVFLVIQGLSDNGGRPTTGLMGTLLGALLLIIVLGSSIKHPVNALLIGVAPLTGLFTFVTSVAGPVSSQMNPLIFETATLRNVHRRLWRSRLRRNLGDFIIVATRQAERASFDTPDRRASAA